MGICLWIIAAAAVAMAMWINDHIRVQEFTFESPPRVREQHEVSWWWIWKGLSELENVWRAWAEGQGEAMRWGGAQRSQEGGRGDKKQKGFFRRLQTACWFQGLEDWLCIDVSRSSHCCIQLLLALNCHLCYTFTGLLLVFVMLNLDSALIIVVLLLDIEQFVPWFGRVKALDFTPRPSRIHWTSLSLCN